MSAESFVTDNFFPHPVRVELIEHGLAVVPPIGKRETVLFNPEFSILVTNSRIPFGIAALGALHEVVNRNHGVFVEFGGQRILFDEQDLIKASNQPLTGDLAQRMEAQCAQTDWWSAITPEAQRAFGAAILNKEVELERALDAAAEAASQKAAV